MYPNRTDYKKAVLNGMFPVEKNGGYEFLPVLEKGELIVASGGNATVFKVTNDKGIEFAIKLFSEELKGRFQRLLAISKYLENTSLKFFTHFKFVQDLIYVEIPGLQEIECYFPGIVMNWVEGENLEVKIRQLVEDKKLPELKQIAKNFKDISLFLLHNGIAHGDLKLSNILVNEKLELILIDYDGMFLPELAGQDALENGTPSYQHPKRSDKNFDDTIDHFSILNIYTSLIALSERPELFNDHNDGDNIIFVKEDFDNPESSKLFNEFSRLNLQPRLIYFLKKSLSRASIDIENIIDLLNGNFPIPKLVVTHTPEQPLVGQNITVKWETFDTDFVKINGKEEKGNGTIEFAIDVEAKIAFLYGTALDQLFFEYSILAQNPPSIIEFNASNTDIKFDEPILLSWKVENTKKVMLCFDGKKIDVTEQNEYSIPSLKSDTTISLQAESSSTSFTINKELLVKVHYPVKLQVRQDLKIVFSNRPVKLHIQCMNAEQIILTPQNVDLLGKPTFNLRVAESTYYKIVASNKRYSEEFESFIDVIKAPSLQHKVIEIPAINLSLPALPFTVPTLKETLNNKGSFDRKIILANNFLNKFNLFKVTLNKKKYDRSS